MKIIKKILIFLGILKLVPKYFHLYSKPEKIYKILREVYSLNIQHIFPIIGDKRFEFVKIIFDTKDILRIRYKIFESNRSKYLACYQNTNSSFIDIEIKFYNIENDRVRNYRVDYLLTGFVSGFEDFFFKSLKVIERQPYYILSLSGIGDLILAYNKMNSFLNKFRDILFSIDMDPIYEQDTKIVDQFNMKIVAFDSIGSKYVVESYHQDNKLKCNLANSLEQYNNSLEKLKNTINSINNLLKTDKDRTYLNLHLFEDDYGNISIYSNSTLIIRLSTTNEYEEFIYGALDSFKRILSRGICRVEYNNEYYTCFKGVLNKENIIELVAISGEMRLLVSAIKFDKIEALNEEMQRPNFIGDM